MTIVCDTNVLISALLFPGGPPDEILKLVREGYAKLAISMEICAEFEGVLREKFEMPEKDTKEVIKSIREISFLVQPKEKISLIKEDPPDNRILECTVAADADYIVSDDAKHLQPLKEFKGIPILSPAKFLFLI